MNNELKSEDKEILQSLNRIVNIIKDALDKEAIDAAFFCSLSIPDIMGQFCYPELREYTNKNVVGKRYIRWYDEHVFKYENPPLNKNYDDNIFQNINQIDGTILYAIRCKYFHQGNLVHNEVKSKLQKKYHKLIGSSEKELKLDISFNSTGTSYGYSTTNYDNFVTIKVNIGKRDLSKILMLHGMQLLKVNKESLLLDSE